MHNLKEKITLREAESRVAAILFAEIAGYAELKERNEALAQHRKEKCAQILSGQAAN